MVGSLVKIEMLVDQLLNCQRLVEELTEKLRRSEEEKKVRITELENEYKRLLEEIATSTQDQGHELVAKVDDLSKQWRGNL